VPRQDAADRAPRAGHAQGEALLRRYVHLGTGNYHPRTARLYTDFGLLTADEKICEDVHHVFQLLTGTAGTIRLNHLWQSPFTMHSNLVEHIRAEAATHARASGRASSRR
jgi:polyphosphate kinase